MIAICENFFLLNRPMLISNLLRIYKKIIKVGIILGDNYVDTFKFS